MGLTHTDVSNDIALRARHVDFVSNKLQLTRDFRRTS